MALIDCDYWYVRRKLQGSLGASVHQPGIEDPTNTLRLPYLKARARTPVHRRAPQARAQSSWAHANYLWRHALSEYQRWEWSTYAPEDFPAWLDEINIGKPLYGHRLYVAFASRALAAGLTPILDYDDIIGPLPIYSLDAEITSADTVELSFSPPLDEFTYLVAHYRGPLSAGRHAFIQQPYWYYDSTPCGWSLLGYSTADPASPVVFTLPTPCPVGAKLPIHAYTMGPEGLTWNLGLHANPIRES